MRYWLLILIVCLAVCGAASAATVTLVPDSNGDASQIVQFYPNANHFANVNIDDNFGSYNYMFIAGTKYDLYNLQDTAVTGTINSVTVNVRLYAGSAVAGQRSYGTVKIKTGGVEYNGTESQIASQPYSGSIWPNYSYTWTTNPGGGAWTWSAINGLQAGVQLREESASQPSAITYCYVVVDYGPGAATASDAIFFGGD